MLIFEIAYASLGTLDHVIQHHNVIGVNSCTYAFKRHRRAGFKPEDPVELFRPDNLVRLHPPYKVAHSGEMLALREKRFAATQFFLDEFSRCNVRGESDHPK